MKAQIVRGQKNINKKSLSQYQRSIRQNSSFHHSQQLNTPQHYSNLQYGEILCYTKQSLKTSNELTCSNKLCQYFINTICEQNGNSNGNSNLQYKQINIDTLCLKCQQQYKKQSFCIYCKQIYYDSTDDGKQWIMCQDCEKWVHTQCADFNTKQNSNIIFKCIKCKKLPKENLLRRNIQRTVSNKIQKRKNNSQFLMSIGFQWELSVGEIAQDMFNIQQYLGVG